MGTALTFLRRKGRAGRRRQTGTTIGPFSSTHDAPSNSDSSLPNANGSNSGSLGSDGSNPGSSESNPGEAESNSTC